MYFDVANRSRHGAKRDGRQSLDRRHGKGVFGATKSRQPHRPQTARRTSNWFLSRDLYRLERWCGRRAEIAKVTLRDVVIRLPTANARDFLCILIGPKLGPKAEVVILLTNGRQGQR